MEPTMTPTEVRRLLLEGARVAIQAGSPSYICPTLVLAFNRTRPHPVGEHNTLHYLRSEIRGTLYPFGDLDSWLRNQLGLGHLRWADLPKPYDQLANSRSPLGKQIRLAWIDRMLEDLQ
jgi:hypothetical protein